MSRPPKPPPPRPPKPPPPPPGIAPRTFEDPFHAARLARLDSGESFDGVSVHPDCEGGSHWFVEWFDSDGGFYVTTFNGPLAEQRARDYFGALKAGRLKVLRAPRA
jgi:hypothetical protein